MPAWLSMVFLLDLKESTCVYQDRLLTNKTLQPFNDLILKYNHGNSFYGFGFQICMFWNCIGNSKLACDSMCMDACREIQIFFLLVFFFLAFLVFIGHFSYLPDLGVGHVLQFTHIMHLRNFHDAMHITIIVIYHSDLD